MVLAFSVGVVFEAFGRATRSFAWIARSSLAPRPVVFLVIFLVLGPLLWWSVGRTLWKMKSFTSLVPWFTIFLGFGFPFRISMLGLWILGNLLGWERLSFTPVLKASSLLPLLPWKRGTWFWIKFGLGLSIISLSQDLVSIFQPPFQTFECSVWMWLPNLPLQYWEMIFYEAIGNSIGSFLKVDEPTSIMGHYTYARFLVNIDISLPLHGEVVLMVGKSTLVLTFGL